MKAITERACISAVYAVYAARCMKSFKDNVLALKKKKKFFFGVRCSFKSRYHLHFFQF